MVPYVDYKFKKSSISQIVMNPYNCEDSSMMELGIQELLAMNDLDNVKIYHSNIPLRRYDYSISRPRNVFLQFLAFFIHTACLPLCRLLFCPKEVLD